MIFAQVTRRNVATWLAVCPSHPGIASKRMKISSEVLLGLVPTVTVFVIAHMVAKF